MQALRFHLRTLTLALPLAAAVALLGACDDGSVSTHPAPLTTDYQLRSDMRTAWAEHATWTRVVIIAMAARLPDTDAATERLLRNQDDIGDAVRPYWGDATADHLTVLLREHITGAAAVIAAARVHDATALEAARASWYANGDAIANAIADACPMLDRGGVQTMMRTHLDQTLTEAASRLGGDYDGDVAAYGAVATHLAEMSDAIAAGITAQFPTLVVPSTMPPAEQALRLGMRARFEARVAWTRFYVIEAVADLPSWPQTSDRLLRAESDLGAAFATYYGDEEGGRITALLRERATALAAVALAARLGDDTALQAAADVLYANADETATLLAGTNPVWTASELSSALRADDDASVTQATARARADFSLDVKAYDEGESRTLLLSDRISDGLVAQFAGRFR